jgi:cytochrome oxidase Cu insertion factor (SCO1/SenC/PrrC family)
LVSISVDPEHDTPEILARYAQNFKAQAQRWLFLTGEKAAVHRLVRDGFHLGLQDPRQPVQSSTSSPGRQPGRLLWPSGFTKLVDFGPAVALAHHGTHAPQETAPLLVHSGRLVLVDRQGQIRSYCDSNDENAWRRLPRDVKFLLRSSAL